MLKGICSALFILMTLAAASQNVYERTLKLMGSRFDITVVANSETEGNQYIDLAVNEIARIEKATSFAPSKEA